MGSRSLRSSSARRTRRTRRVAGALLAAAARSQALGHDAPSHRDFEELLDQASGPKLPGNGSHRIAYLLAHRYTRGALIVTSNLEFADWTSVFAGDERLTAALLDRLTHRCHLLEFRGSSYRFRQSLAAREGRPDGALATPSPD